MRISELSIALCVALSATAASGQTIPDYLSKRVPTARDAGPLSTDKTVEDYLKDGYAIQWRTRLVGRFTGCRTQDEIRFEDRSLFVCYENIEREEISPPVVFLRNVETGAYAIFIGRHNYVGLLRFKKGVKLDHHIRFGDPLLGIPTRVPEDRRTIGPVDVSNGKIAPIPRNRSAYQAPTQEVSAFPSNPPPMHTTLNPNFSDPVGK
jgi:hypothetical protein